MNDSGRSVRKLEAGSLSLILVLLLSLNASAQKTDVIEMPNGDRITGEIKFLERGRLDYSVDRMRRLSVEWPQLVKVRSDKFFDFELSNARHLFGSIEEADEPGFLIIVTDTARSKVRIRDVVRIEPLRSNFWGRLKGSSVELGVDFTRVNLQRQWNLTTKVKYRTKKWLLTFDGDSYLNVQDEREPSRRNNASLTPQRFLGRGYSLYGVLKAEQNDELNLELRASAVLGVSKFLLRTNRQSLETRIGAALNEEKFTGSELSASGEGVVSVDYSLFKFITPKIDIRFDTFVYPSLTDWGRYRGNVNAAIQWEPVTDFRIGLNGFFTFDTRPGEGASNVDYGAFSSIGISI